ncbi:SatD family protein [Sphingomonas sp. Leaf257]|jgi:hypothetical protein|uniref:SatD family protein n=1 Tax=Sphingomonas sp. Leaf257 TaxID=1736309 RepID=UPI0007004725|nr:SatD family protein [Sphingomonas sp. Leaf257]KQO58692.1 hypothetical protein ASF14_01830 [Sphingomonas sp. Leaf257]
MSFFAVLMGDLVDSEEYEDARYLHSAFNSAVERQKALLADDMASPLTITLGDEFQGLLHSLDAAAKAARNIRFDLMLHDIDCRFVIGIVDIKTPLNSERAWNMMGPGFAAARERLGEKRSPNRYRFSIPQDALLETLLEAIGGSLSAIERKWSRVQRDVIITLSEDVSVAELAQARDVGIANIYKVRSAGEYDRYMTEWDAVHTALAELDIRYGLMGAD